MQQAVDLDLEHLDFDSTPPTCDAVDCTREAAYRFACRGCDNRFLVCAKCTDDITRIANAEGCYCKGCGRSGSRLSQVLAVYPLGSLS